MSNLVVSTLVDTFMGSADLPAAQATLGISNGLPVWTWAAADISTPSAGHFTSNSAAISTTGALALSDTAKDGSTGWVSLMESFFQTPFILILADASGKIQAFEITSVVGAGSFIQLNTTPVVGNSNPNWSALGYSASFMCFPVAAPTLTAVLAQSSITPAADSTTTPVTSLTTQTGIVTDKS